jgi:HD-like signal output (HDOD) protein
MSLNVLFVDDDPFLLQAIERSLMFSCPDWAPEFAPSGESAIELLNQQPFDVVVSDMRMPGMNGAQLLEHVSQNHPRTIRIILSGQSDLERAFQTLGPAHQYLSKPCQVGQLQTILEHAIRLRDHLQSERLQQVIASMKTMPALPDQLARLSQMLESTTASASDIGLEISRDIGMTAKVLQMANSPLFGTGRPMVDVSEAVAFLGFDLIHSLIFSYGVFSKFENPKFNPEFVRDLTTHSVKIGAGAFAIAKRAAASPIVQNQSLLAGLLHDLGKLILADLFPESYSDVNQVAASSQKPVWQSEQAVFKANHSDVAAYLLSLWGITHPVVEAVAFHHQPELANVTKFSPLVAVYLANELARLKLEADPTIELVKLQNFCDATGVKIPLNEWLESSNAPELSQ